MKSFFFAAGLLFGSLYGYTQKTVVHCGNLIDGKNKAVQKQMTLVIEGNRITAVEKGFTPVTTGDTLIDLSTKTVMPGLIDLHVHIESETSREQALQRFTLNEADIAFRASCYAKKTLMAGFTTVRDLG
ncbi:MAG TPA: amidohydrolase family protein, partial [Chryseosolibacter sp.]|nr:amidohydrolase family protein [Chryseosolibacter sp.]